MQSKAKTVAQYLASLCATSFDRFSSIYVTPESWSSLMTMVDTAAYTEVT